METGGSTPKEAQGVVTDVNDPEQAKAWRTQEDLIFNIKKTVDNVTEGK